MNSNPIPTPTLTISRRIWLLISLTIATFVVAFSCSFIGLQRVQSGVDELARGAFPRVTSVSTLREASQSMQLTIFELASNTEASKAAEIIGRLDALQDKVFSSVDDYDKRTVSEADKALMLDVKTSLGAYVAKLSRVKGLAKMGETQMAFDVLNREIMPLYKTFSGALDKLVQFNTGRANSVAETASGAYHVTVGVTITAALIGIAFIALAGIFLGRSITLPLGAMQRAITRTADNLDFTHAIAVKGNDEIGLTLHAYNGLLARLRGSFGDIQRSSLNMDKSTAEIEVTARNIASNSQTQSDAAASMATAVEQMTTSISLIADRAQEAAHHTQESEEIANRSAEVILATIEGIQSISTCVQTASDRINTLQRDSHNISAVAQIIREIADQTNLLALNAAIEAARAGEQGRGFAVVADEVRKLAERTASSTQQINDLITQMQSGAQQAVESMSSAVDEVSRGVDNANKAGSAIHEIQDGSHRAVSVVEEISKAISEQSSVSTDIARKIEHIARMTDQNSASAANSAHAVSSVAQLSQQIASAVAKYNV